MTDDEFQNRVLTFPDPPFFDLFEELENRIPTPNGKSFRELHLELLKVATREQLILLRELIQNRLSNCHLTSEERICRALRRAIEYIKDGADIVETLELRRICYGLEYFIPAVLAKVYPHWNEESLDGIFCSEARKLNPEWAEFYGMCILISDQTLTPIYIQLKITPTEDKIKGMECRIGKRGSGKGEMERIPFARWRNNPLAELPISKEKVDWVYKISNIS